MNLFVLAFIGAFFLVPLGGVIFAIGKWRSRDRS